MSAETRPGRGCKTVWGLSAGNGRGAPVGKDLLGGNKNGDDYARRDFHPMHRHRRLHFTDCYVHVPRRKHLHGAIVIIRDGTAMEPGMQRRANFRRGHEQPDEQRHCPRHAVQISPRLAIQLKWQKHRSEKQQLRQLQIICNIGMGAMYARIIYNNIGVAPNWDSHLLEPLSGL